MMSPLFIFVRVIISFMPKPALIYTLSYTGRPKSRSTAFSGPDLGLFNKGSKFLGGGVGL